MGVGFMSGQHAGSVGNITTSMLHDVIKIVIYTTIQHDIVYMIEDHITSYLTLW